MITLERDFIMNTTARQEDIQGNMFNGETAAHQFVITAITDAQTRTETSFSGTATAYFIRSDDQTLTVSASVINGKIYATLNRDCYNLTGRFTFSIFNQNEGVTTCVYSCVGWMYRTRRDPIIDSGEVVPNIDDVTAEYQRMQAATDAATAAASAGNGAFRAFAPYNAYDVLATLAKTNATFDDGVAFTWDAEGNCHVSGTAASAHVNNLWSNQAALPLGLEPGKSYNVTCAATGTFTTSQPWFSFRWYINGAWSALVYAANNGTTKISVPSEAVGAQIRFGISEGNTVDVVLSPKMIYGVSNDELQALSFFDRGAVGSSGDTVDLNDLTEAGFYRLVSSRTYVNSPVTSISKTAVLEVLTGTSIISQRFTDTAKGNIYFRQSAGGSLEGIGWTYIGVDKPDVLKYVAFGDSRMYGAVWNSTAGGTIHQCAEKLRIPTRIAWALGAYNNFSNEAIGGIGYVKKSGGVNLVDQITAYDFSGVEYVTISGGANDKLTEAGTLDAICEALQTIITYIKGNYPKVHIIVMQPLPSGFNKDRDPWTTTGAGNWSLDMFDERVSALCRDNHVGYVSWRGCPYCDTWAEHNVGYYGSSTPNYTHPVVDEDYALLGDYIAGKIMALGDDGLSTVDSLNKSVSMMGMIHHWAIIGASYDTGEFNYKINYYKSPADAQNQTNPHEGWREYEGYDYSPWTILKKRNGIPDLYHYANGGQNARDWLRYGEGERPARTYAYTTGLEEVATVSYFTHGGGVKRNPDGTYSPDTGDVYDSDHHLAPYRSGVACDGGAGGNWWKLKADLQAGKRYQAYLINLGSNDINNNYPGTGWDPDTTETGAEVYKWGEVGDIGTYNKETDADILPAGKSAGEVGLNIVNSYAAYIGAIINRIVAWQPDAYIFLCTVRKGFSTDSNKKKVWENYNATLKAVAERFRSAGAKIYIVDNGKYGPDYDAEPMVGMKYYMHPNALGYQHLAKSWNEQIDRVIRENYADFNQSMFVGGGDTGLINPGIPPLPTTDGQYRLTATITNGAVAYSWEAV